MDYKIHTMNLLQKLGIQKMYKGCEYIISSINYMERHEKYFTPVTKVLYVEIAKEYNTSSICVEKNVRAVIKTIWEQCVDKELMKKIFGEYNIDKRPSNMEFLVLLYNHLKYYPDKYTGIPREKPDYTFTCPLSGNACEFCEEFIIETMKRLEKK